MTAVNAMAAIFVGASVTAPGSPRGPMPPRPTNWGYYYAAQQPGAGGSAPVRNPSPEGPAAPEADGPHKSGPQKAHICGSWRNGIAACPAIPLPADPAEPEKAQVSPAQLAVETWGQMPIPAPTVATAPPRGSHGLVGLAEWFWVTNWKAHHDRAQAGNAWTEVTARPTGLTINPGAGQHPMSCVGPGTAYDRKRSAGAQRSDCSYVYTRSSAGLPGAVYRVTVTVTWGGTWVGSDGSGGTLPPLSRSTTFRLRVDEGQAVTGG